MCVVAATVLALPLAFFAVLLVVGGLSYYANRRLPPPAKPQANWSRIVLQ